MERKDVIHDLSKEIAKIFIETNKEQYKSENNLSKMIYDFYKVYAMATKTIDKYKE